MRRLFGNHTVYLLSQGRICHLIHSVNDWTTIKGDLVATFDPHRGRHGRWVNPGLRGDDDEPMTLEELYTCIPDNAEVCALGKNCPKHK